MQPVDTVIEARWVVPVEPARLVLEHHAVVVDKGKIVALEPIAQARERYVPAQRVELPQHIVSPGLVNAHGHAAMTLLRGYADDTPLMTWLQEHIWPAEGKLVSAEFVKAGSLHAAAEMLLGGVTTMNDMYFFPGATAEAALQLGMRAAVGIVAFEFPSAYGSNADDYINKGLQVRDALRGESLVSFTLAPHAPYTVADATFTRIRALADELQLPVHIHLHETAFEVEESVKQHGMRPIARLDKLGLVSPGLIAVHAVHMNEADIALLAKHNASVAHCPASNLKLASGIAPVAAMLNAGVNVAIGTDGAASNNKQDLWAETRLAALLAKGASGDAAAFPAHAALHAATLGGAKALGLDAQIGSLTPGKAADITALSLENLELSPIYNCISHMIYAADRQHVSDVWVAGRHVVKARQLQTGHLPDLIRSAGVWQNRARGN